MDPTDTDSIRQALVSQRALVGQHEKILCEEVETLQRLGRQMERISSDITTSPGSANTSPPGHPSQPLATHRPPPVSTHSSREPFMPTPECYSRDLRSCGHFLIQCLVFN